MKERGKTIVPKDKNGQNIVRIGRPPKFDNAADLKPVNARILVIPEKIILRNRGNYFCERMAIHFGIPTKFKPINYKQKESSQELSHIIN